MSCFASWSEFIKLNLCICFYYNALDYPKIAMSSSNHLFIGSIIHWVSIDEMEVITDGFIAVEDGKVIYY